MLLEPQLAGFLLIAFVLREPSPANLLAVGSAAPGNTNKMAQPMHRFKIVHPALQAVNVGAVAILMFMVRHSMPSQQHKILVVTGLSHEGPLELLCVAF